MRKQQYRQQKVWHARVHEDHDMLNTKHTVQSSVVLLVALADLKSIVINAINISNPNSVRRVLTAKTFSGKFLPPLPPLLR